MESDGRERSSFVNTFIHPSCPYSPPQSLQLRILQRAMRMLRRAHADEADSPRIVYSTCSLNPVENEAVVAAALNSIPGNLFVSPLRNDWPDLFLGFELVDASDVLTDLKRRPGLSSWRPAVNRDVDVSYASYEEYCDALESKFADETRDQETKLGVRDRVIRNRMRKTHWPPTNAEELHLDRWSVLFHPFTLML